MIIGGPTDPTNSTTPAADPTPAVQSAEAAPSTSPETVTRYLDLQHSERTPTPSGNFEEQTTTATHGPEALPNSRSTPAGRNADEKVRAGWTQRTGMDWGHNEPTSAGAPPADAVNGSPQNSIQNRSGGTWFNNDKSYVDTLRNDPGKITQSEVRSLYRPGSDVPIARQRINTLADGTKTGQDVIYLNNDTPSSREATARAAEGKTLEPGEADRLNKPFKDFLKQQANTDPAELDAKRAQWNQMKADRGIGVAPDEPGAITGRSATGSALEAGAADAGKLGKFVKGAGVIGMAAGAYDLGKAAEESYKEGSIAPVAKEAAKQVGGWAGAAAGAEAGAALGAALGIESGPGALITGAIGGVVGGIAGSLGVSVSIDAITSLF